MKVYFSMVSHGHSDLIKTLGCLSDLAEDFIFVVKSNKPGDDFDFIDGKDNFHWIDSDYYLGFGHNNNIVFKYCKEKLNINDDDLFITINPDVVINRENVDKLKKEMSRMSVQLGAINLYRDVDFTEYDNSVRHFPTLFQFISSFLVGKNTSIINKSEIDEMQSVDWAAGSFLCFNASHYLKLFGFDQRYFMYCEDIDICWRSTKLGSSVYYIPSVKALHMAQHANRKIISKHFYWHVTGVFRFLMTKMKFGIVKSILKTN